MTSFLTILLFFVYTWGFGYSMTFFFKNSENWLERNLMRIGFGLGGFIVVGVLLNFLGIILDWKIFLALALLGPIVGLVKSKGKITKLEKIKLNKLDFVVFIVLLIFAITFFMYAKGAFSYSYLEDDDPWVYAESAKYIAVEKTLYRPDWAETRIFNYLDPYPPGYVLLMGVLHQTSPSVNWTLKFFNALIISFGVIFFFFFAYRLLKDRNKALFATGIFAMIPVYLTHFIWSHALVPTLGFVILYGFLMMNEEKKWLWSVMILFGGVFLIHPRHPFKVVIFVLIFGVFYSIFKRKTQWKYLWGILGGVVISLLWWLPKNKWIEQFIMATGDQKITASSATTEGIGNFIVSVLHKVTKFALNPEGGTATRTYSFNDFFFAQKQNLINSPVGIGVVVSLLTFLGILAMVLFFSTKLNQNELKSKGGKWAVKFFKACSYVLAAILALRYITLLFGGQNAFGFLYSLWFDLGFYLAAIGLGVLTLIVVKEEKLVWRVAAISWLTIFLLLVNPSYFNFPIGMSPFRTWMHLVLPLALIATEGAYLLKGLIGKKNNYLKWLVLGLLLLGVFYTSGLQKYTVNTAKWSPGGAFSSYEEVDGYIWMKDNLPIDSRVYSFYDQKRVIGLDQFACSWCKDIRDYSEHSIEINMSENYDWFKDNEFDYVVFSARYLDWTNKIYGEENSTKLLNTRINEAVDMPNKFKVVHQKQGFILFQII